MLVPCLQRLGCSLPPIHSSRPHLTPTPDFLVQLAQKSVRSQKVAAVDRAREAFCAGYWFRIGLKCEVNLSSSYSPSLPPAHWVVEGDQRFATSWIMEKRVHRSRYIYIHIYVHIVSMYMYMHVYKIGICICKHIFSGLVFGWCSRFQRTLAVQEPYYKQFMDGSLGIRVDDPSEIVDASSASSPSDFKTLGNKCFQAKEHQQALDFYKKALETWYAHALFFKPLM